MDKNKKKHILDHFGLSVKKKRLAQLMTQEELAERANFHVNFIGGIERGLRNPTLISLVELAKGLGCSLTELLSGIHQVDVNNRK